MVSVNESDGVRIYTACVDCLKDPALYQRTLEILPPTRRASADRMKVESGKRLSAGAGLLLMAALADYQTKDLQAYADFRDIRVEIGEQGKPYLPDHPKVHFNLSHSGNRVICAVGPVEVGCDVETVKESHIKTVIRCFAESEQIVAARSAENFFRLWTLKESIVKLSGKGLLIPLKSFEVSLDPLSVRQDFLPEPVILREYEIPDTDTDMDTENHYCASCAAAGAGLPPDMIPVELDRLLMGEGTCRT